jgi:hypothetical protein
MTVSKRVGLVIVATTTFGRIASGLTFARNDPVVRA